MIWVFKSKENPISNLVTPFPLPNQVMNLYHNFSTDWVNKPRIINFSPYKIYVKGAESYKWMSCLSEHQFLKRSLLMPGKQLHLKYNWWLWILLLYSKLMELQKFGRFRSAEYWNRNDFSLTLINIFWSVKLSWTVTRTAYGVIYDDSVFSPQIYFSLYSNHKHFN